MIINGIQTSTLDANDRAIQYGDGHFTTLLVKNGQPQLWDYHLMRLQTANQRLFINPLDWAALTQQVSQQASLYSLAVLKVIITRGMGGRGYAPGSDANPTWIISVHDFPGHYPQWQQTGIKLGVSTLYLGHQPLLAGLKSLNRLEQVLIKQQAMAMPWDDVLVCDVDGMLVESSAANLFWCRDGQWYTPDLAYCGIEGVMRNCVLDYFSAINQKVTQVRARPDILHDAEAVFVCNSLMELVPVREIDGVSYDITPVLALQEVLCAG